MVDLDNFKSINDRYGHPCGDEYLRAVAGLLLSTVRKPDTLARYGGDEFVLILPQSTVEGGKNIAERLRAIIGNFVFRSSSGKEMKSTASFGVTQYRREMAAKDFVAEVDNALYAAKQNGRNNCIISG
jgi:diguanylate cyclase